MWPPLVGEIEEERERVWAAAVVLGFGQAGPETERRRGGSGPRAKEGGEEEIEPKWQGCTQ